MQRPAATQQRTSDVTVLTVSHYRVLEKIGEGGMGVVFRAEDTTLGRIVALKALPGDVLSDPVRRKRFIQEARAAGAMSHPAVATIHDFVEDGENLYIVMEYVEGRSLRSLVSEAPLDYRSAVSIGRQLAEGLAAAHAMGIVHRDLKPENILITDSGQIKILDFGLAQYRRAGFAQIGDSTVTEPGLIAGTVAYMAPEQLEGREADCRSDIFSIGVILYELVTGTHPFQGASTASTIANIMSVTPPPMAVDHVKLPEPLNQVVFRCLSKNCTQRYQSARELLAVMQLLHSSDTISASDFSAMSRYAPAEQPLLHQWLAFAKPTPKRWWEVNQLFCIAAYPAVAYTVWRVRPWMPSSWEPATIGLMVVFAALTTTLRLYLLLTAAFMPELLEAEARRWRVSIRVVSCAIWAGLAVAALLIFPQHRGVGALMAGLAIGGFVSTVVAEDAINRGAFPS